MDAEAEIKMQSLTTRENDLLHLDSMSSFQAQELAYMGNRRQAIVHKLKEDKKTTDALYQDLLIRKREFERLKKKKDNNTAPRTHTKRQEVAISLAGLARCL